MAAVVEFDPTFPTRTELVEVLGGQARQPGSGPLPLRGALLVVLSLAMLVLAFVSLGGPGGADRGDVVPERSGEFVIVGPGDTALSIVTESGLASGSVSAREAVDGLILLNGGSDALEVGQVVALPAID